MRILLLTLILLPLFSSASQFDLPELGESSATSLTPEQERYIGAEMLQRMRRADLIIEDPLVANYIKHVGQSLSVHTQSEFDFTFFVVNAPGINAFAIPGGYIGIHSGLILASRNESELASVIAHEIAHVTQHHLARGIELANRMQLPMSVALIAAILLSGGDADVVNAAMAASAGGSQQMQLDFTRAHEHEADRVGIQLLADAEYDPRGMTGFFSRLQEEARYYGEGLPEFLSTHPVTTARLAEAQSAADKYPPVMRLSPPTYLVAKARLRLHHAKNPSILMKELESDERKPDETTLYLTAITESALNQFKKAEMRLQGLLVKRPESIAYRETLGQLQYQQGAHTQAIRLYREGLRLYPNNEVLTLSLVKVLIADKQYQAGREQLQEVLRHQPESSTAYRLLAELESAAGNLADSYLAQAEFYQRINEPHSALEQLKQAKRIKNLDFYHSERVEALKKEIEEQVIRERTLLD